MTLKARASVGSNAGQVSHAGLEQCEQALVTAAIGGDEKAIATAVRVQERKATPLGSNAPLRVDSSPV